MYKIICSLLRLTLHKYYLPWWLSLLTAGLTNRWNITATTPATNPLHTCQKREKLKSCKILYTNTAEAVPASLWTILSIHSTGDNECVYLLLLLHCTLSESFNLNGVQMMDIECMQFISYVNQSEEQVTCSNFDIWMDRCRSFFCFAQHRQHNKVRVNLKPA